MSSIEFPTSFQTIYSINYVKVYPNLTCSALLSYFYWLANNLVPRVFLIGKTLVSAGHVTPLQIVVFGGVGEVRIVN